MNASLLETQSDSRWDSVEAFLSAVLALCVCAGLGICGAKLGANVPTMPTPVVAQAAATACDVQPL